MIKEIQTWEISPTLRIFPISKETSLIWKISTCPICPTYQIWCRVCPTWISILCLEIKISYNILINLKHQISLLKWKIYLIWRISTCKIFPICPIWCQETFLIWKISTCPICLICKTWCKECPTWILKTCQIISIFQKILTCLICKIWCKDCPTSILKTCQIIPTL